MRIGYIYLFGQEYEEWKKHNRPVSALIDELKELGCEKIYMDIFIEDCGFKEIERIDIKELLDKILNSPGDDHLIVRGRAKKINESDEKGLLNQVKKEVTRIYDLNNVKT
jgi:hypothetical protein